MALSSFVEGPVVVNTGTGGAGALQQLGISEQGIEPEVTRYINKLMADNAGINVPADIQDMGSDAVVRCVLPIFDAAVESKVMLHAGQATPGLMPSMGKLIGASGSSFRLTLISTTGISGTAAPVNYPQAWVCGTPWKQRFASRYTILNITFYCWAAIGVNTSASGVVLYSNAQS